MPDPSTYPSTDPSTLAEALATVDSLGAMHAAAAVVEPGGVFAAHGDPEYVFPWASVTKLVTGLAILTAIEDGTIDLHEAAPPPAPPGATIRHLLAHASGLPFDGDHAHGRPGTRRIYSNTGFDLLGALLAERDDRPFEAALRARVVTPLGMGGTVLAGRPSQGLHGPLQDLTTFAAELIRPTLVSATFFADATHVAYEGLPGVLPGVGRFDTLDWGLAFELRDSKVPHWTGTRNSPGTFGHFGGSGTFLWVDPVLDVALACLTDRTFGPWALEAWPSLSDSVIEALSGPAG
ncbi:MAG: serine hydrolase domain-containing protein [Candidatus Limnocylindrales bacterium]